MKESGSQSRFDSVVDKLADEIVLAAVSRAHEKLGKQAAAPAVAAEPTPKKTAAVVVVKARRGRPARQAQVAAIEGLSEKIVEYITANPGARTEQIAKTLGASSKALALPIKQLLSDGTLRKTGKVRATAYFVK